MNIVSIDLMEYENGIWRIDGSISRSLPGEQFLIRLNGEPLPFRFVYRYAQITVGEETQKDRQAFVLEIPAKRLGKQAVLRFAWKKEEGEERPLPVLASCYPARLHSGLKQIYWCFGGYMATWEGGRTLIPVRKEGQEAEKEKRTGEETTAETAKGLRICRAGRAARIRQELKFLREIASASYGSRKMFAIRCLYWLAFPFYSGKNIWITFDKLYKGGDCGEYFYKYMTAGREGFSPAAGDEAGGIRSVSGEKRKNRISGKNADGVVPVYVLKKNAPDFGRLRRGGYRPAAYRSLGQRLSYLYARMVFGTHSGVNSFCGFNNWEIRFVQDRLRAVNACIQHGLSVQDLRADSHRAVNNNKRYYCASRYEVENLSKPEYDYDKETLRLTGIPRYDGLESRDKKQILISPTWRSYLAMPSVMGEARPYNPDFKHTDYYRIYQNLLENRRLAETAEKTGYRVIYLLHPVISAQKEDFHPEGGIQVKSALDVNYEEILTQSSLMVTDYSGLQFDFAYMRKPVVYFHPPKLPPHYEDGGFFYDTQGFGEICADGDELVELLCSYMEAGCPLKKFYRARQDDFFAWNDRENCRRIYEDALEYQRQTAGADGKSVKKK